ncbi:WXG100 family type VII secretion target [Bacillus pseudomycoides]|uniref:WXG100 family type VII secretion target n=1 Tax=Bacillus pseudomycoides TaxID=64104 RepID=UPI001FB44525|nr:WXG100 family type VII secretion target [Bacillus pseudomycoides]
MGNIKVTPEQLRKVALSIRSTITNATATQERLKKDIDMLCNAWMGATYMKFNTDFRDSSLKMAQFTIILEPLEKFLLDSANKFEQVDKMDVAIAMASTILTGKPFKGDYETFVGKTDFSTDGKLMIKGEGSIFKGELELAEGTNYGIKAGNGLFEGNIPYTFKTISEDLVQGNLIGAKFEANALDHSFSKKLPFAEDLTVTQKFLNGSYVFGIDQYTFKNDYELTAHKYEVVLNKIEIPDYIPFLGDYDITLKGEYGFGYGYKFHLGKETGGYATAPNGHGGGFFFKFDKDKKE